MLNVDIVSFSYKGGMPKCSSPHGGGFVFDCRGIKNPGRLPEFKNKSGLDKETKEFLSNLPEAEQFFNSVISIVDLTLKSFTDRGFDSLMITFGCTGGQHRSVYFAEKLAERLRSNPKIKITITHREKDGWAKGELL